MASFDELEKLNLANSIINRSNLSLGLRPMQIPKLKNVELDPREIEKQNQIHQEEQFSIEAVAVDPEEFIEFEEFELEAAEVEIEHEAYEEAQTPQETFPPKTVIDKEIQNRFPEMSSRGFNKITLYTSLAVICAVFFVFAFKPVSTASNSGSLEETDVEIITKIDASKGQKNLVICSGNFKSKQQALDYKKSLAARLGVPLQVIDNEGSYSVQIGPAYGKHADALLVFDELSRYSVKNLSIKVAT